MNPCLTDSVGSMQVVDEENRYTTPLFSRHIVVALHFIRVKDGQHVSADPILPSGLCSYVWSRHWSSSNDACVLRKLILQFNHSSSIIQWWVVEAIAVHFVPSTTTYLWEFTLLSPTIPSSPACSIETKQCDTPWPNWVKNMDINKTSPSTVYRQFFQQK